MKGFLLVALLCFVSVGTVLGATLNRTDHTSDEKRLDDRDNVGNLDGLNDYDAAYSGDADIGGADSEEEDSDESDSDEAVSDERAYPGKILHWQPWHSSRPVYRNYWSQLGRWDNQLGHPEMNPWESHDEAKHTKDEDKRDLSSKTPYEPVRKDSMIIKKSSDGETTIALHMKKK